MACNCLWSGDWFWFSTFAQRGWERFGWRDYWKSECNGCNIGKQDVIQFMTGEF